MPGLRDLKRRIKSVQSTRKITRAMQMVSAAKMRKAQAAALSSRTYSDLAWQLIANLSGIGVGEKTPALIKSYPEAKKTGIIVISTNKGLVGSFNTNLFSQLRKMDGQETVAELLVMGKKAKEYAVRFNKNMMADFTKKDTWAPISEIYPLAKMVSDLYASGEYKQILIIYSKFVSTLVQQATVKQLLPFEKTPTDVFASEAKQSNSKEKIASTSVRLRRTTADRSDALAMTGTDYLFEPTPELVLNHLLPRIIESQLYQAVLESDASEHSARMVMMKNATEAAGDLIADYTLTYNQLRQNKITTELAEITAGKIALE